MTHRLIQLILAGVFGVFLLYAVFNGGTPQEYPQSNTTTPEVNTSANPQSNNTGRTNVSSEVTQKNTATVVREYDESVYENVSDIFRATFKEEIGTLDGVGGELKAYQAIVVRNERVTEKSRVEGETVVVVNPDPSFTVPLNETYTLLVDFDANKGWYVLKGILPLRQQPPI